VNILTFLVELTGATMLLLYAVRMVRTGIERTFGSAFRRAVTGATNQPTAAATGLFICRYRCLGFCHRPADDPGR